MPSFLRAFFNFPRRVYSWLCKVFEEEKGGGKKNSIAVLDSVRAILLADLSLG